MDLRPLREAIANLVSPAKKEPWQEMIEDHERCARGTHWHEEHGKCEKLPPELAKKRRSAYYSSRVGSTLSRMAPEEPSGYGTGSHVDFVTAHDAAQSHHSDAHFHHRQAAELADKHGFKELAAKHKEWAQHHGGMKDYHRDTLSNFGDTLDDHEKRAIRRAFDGP